MFCGEKTMRVEPVGAVGMGFGVAAINTVSKSKRLTRIAERERAEAAKKRRPVAVKPDWMGLYVDIWV
jgi:hypothetical protein